MADETIDIDAIKATVEKGLGVARWQLLDKFAFIGEVALHFQLVPTYDKYIRTAATDGKRILFDIEFYSKLTPGQRMFVIAHEVWHNLFLHFKRQGTRQQRLWNIATDCEINHQLQNEGLEVLKDGCFPDACVAGESAEEIYEYLLKKQKNQQNQQQSQKGGNQNGQGGDGDGEGDSDGDDEGDDSSSSSSSSKSKKGKQKKDGGNEGRDPYGNGENEEAGDGSEGYTGKHFDHHMGLNGEDKGDAKEDGKFGPRQDDANTKSQLSKETESEIEEHIKEAAVAAVQAMERNKGHIPAGIESLVKDMMKPQINWKEALSQFVTTCMGGEHSWSRVSRHGVARGLYLPGRKQEKIKCAVCVDTSGSCYGDIPLFLGELDNLLKTFGKYEVTVIQCDSMIESVKKYGSDDEDWDETKFDARGFGGTSFKPPFKYLQENGDEYDCVLYFTDGYGDAPAYPPPYPVMWVITDGGTKDFCEWGEKMDFHINHDEQ